MPAIDFLNVCCPCYISLQQCPPRHIDMICVAFLSLLLRGLTSWIDIMLHSLSSLLPEQSLTITVAATMWHLTGGIIEWELSRPPIMGNTHSSILMFVEESPELGDCFAWASCSMNFLWWCRTDDDGKSCSYGNGEKDPKRTLESPNICRVGSLDILLLCNRLENLELAWRDKIHLYLMNLLLVSVVVAPKLQIFSSTRVSKLLLLFNTLFSSCLILRLDKRRS